MTSSLKVVASLALALAYVPRFGLCPGEGLDCAAAYNHVERGHRPNINTDQTNEPDGDDGDDDDNDDDDDDDETKRRTPYDWPAIAFRLRRILPLILPRHSRLAYVLIGKLLTRCRLLHRSHPLQAYVSYYKSSSISLKYFNHASLDTL